MQSRPGLMQSEGGGTSSETNCVQKGKHACTHTCAFCMRDDFMLRQPCFSIISFSTSRCVALERSVIRVQHAYSVPPSWAHPQWWINLRHWQGPGHAMQEGVSAFAECDEVSPPSHRVYPEFRPGPFVHSALQSTIPFAPAQFPPVIPSDRPIAPCAAVLYLPASSTDPFRTLYVCN